MTELEKMWAALEAYQPIANHKGYGAAWAWMCSDRTAESAAVAADYAAAYDAVYDDDDVLAYAYAFDPDDADADARVSAYAAAAARNAAHAVRADEFVKQAIAHITKASQ